ncbi:hypothetical protein ABPG74_006238 [Tetrahymena malaccensis]
MTKKEFSPEDFLTRAEKIQQLQFPASNKQRVIVLPNNEGLGFRKTCYKDDLVGRIDKKTFDETIIKANKICETTWTKKKCEEEAEYQKSLKVILYIAIFVSLISFILLIVLVYGNGDQQLLWVSICLICVAGGLTLLVVIKSLFSQPTFIDLEQSILQQLNHYFEQQNNQTYEKRGLQWEVHEKFYWLTLHIK